MEHFPILSLRKINYKAAIDEILWIWQKRSNKLEDLNSKIWDQWEYKKSGTIGHSYGYILNKEYNEQSAIELTKSTLNQVFLDKLFEENRIYYAEVIDKLLEIKAFKKISNIDINNTKEDILLEDEDLISVLNITLKTLD